MLERDGLILQTVRRENRYDFCYIIIRGKDDIKNGINYCVLHKLIDSSSI